MQAPDAVSLIKFTDVMALGKENSIDLSKIKYVTFSIPYHWHKECYAGTSQLIFIPWHSQVVALETPKVASFRGRLGNQE